MAGGSGGAGARRRNVWAAAVGRAVPTATPPTVPWSDQPERPAREVAIELVEDARQWALREARGTALGRLSTLRDAVASGRDPARVHARRLRRASRALGVRSVAAGGLGWLTATVGATPDLELGELAWGGATGVVALGAVSAGLRLAELRRTPVPAARPARPRPGRPPRDCPSRRPLDRLADRERALAALLVHLGPAGEEPRAVAAGAAAGLRDLGVRVTAVDRARRGAPADARPGLDTAVAGLFARLDAGVRAYEALVVAAADAVAADATLPAGDAVLALRLDEATESLAGLAAGLREVGR